MVIIRMAPASTSIRSIRAIGAAAAVILCLLAGLAAEASRINYLAREERLCDSSGETCLQGTLSYEVNPRLLWLSGRIRSAPGPGLLQIMLKGSNRLGYVRYAPLEVRIRGNSSEIIDHRIIPDHPYVENWQIDRILFVPEAE